MEGCRSFVVLVHLVWKGFWQECVVDAALSTAASTIYFSPTFSAPPCLSSLPQGFKALQANDGRLCPFTLNIISM